MVLTNGHCVDERPAPNSVVLDQPDRRFVFVKDHNGRTVLRATTDRLVYATITGSDVAVYRLDTSYAQLVAAGVHVFDLARSGPVAGDAIHVASGLIGRHWDCTVDAIVPRLDEAGYTQRDAIRYRSQPGCGPEDNPGHGSSGSPLVSRESGEIVGIHGTGNDDGLECTQNNPCEVGPDGTVTAVKDRKYGQQTAWLNECLVSGSRFDVSRPGCSSRGQPDGTPLWRDREPGGPNQ